MTPAPLADLDGWIGSVDKESRRLARAASEVGLDAAVPSCPGWRVRDVVQHLGGVHRWASAHIVERRTQGMPKPEEERLMSSLPEDAALLDWFEMGHTALVQALSEAPRNLSCWSFLPAPTPLAFWARRQAHETEIHRADVELAGPNPPTPFPLELAADGIEELLFGFAARIRRTKLTQEHRIALLPRDLSQPWLVRLGPEGVRATRGSGDADCTLRGSVSELYLFSWNRIPASALSVEGNAAATSHWASAVRVTWA
ncbi:MAG: maleylpyruvate isomerase family mycothiol-dependent enzyme [Candidatus Dormibacteria bacterium]